MDKRSLEEWRGRYACARAKAIQEIDGLDQGADPEAVFEAVETALLLKLVVTTDGALPMKPDVIDQILDATTFWQMYV